MKKLHFCHETPKYEVIKKRILPWLWWHQRGLLQQEEGDIVGHDGQHVDDVHPVDEEVDLVGAAGEPEEVLKGEPGDANRLNEGKLWIVKGLAW